MLPSRSEPPTTPAAAAAAVRLQERLAALEVRVPKIRYVSAVDANQAVSVMLNEIAKLQHQLLDPDEITGTVQQFLTKYYMGEQTNAAQAGELAQYELIGGGWRNSATFIDQLRAVTPADVQRVSQKYMRNIRFVVLGDPTKIDKSVFTRPVG